MQWLSLQVSHCNTISPFFFYLHTHWIIRISIFTYFLPVFPLFHAHYIPFFIATSHPWFHQSMPTVSFSFTTNPFPFAILYHHTHVIMLGMSIHPFSLTSPSHACTYIHQTHRFIPTSTHTHGCSSSHIIQTRDACAQGQSLHSCHLFSLFIPPNPFFISHYPSH